MNPLNKQYSDKISTLNIVVVVPTYNNHKTLGYVLDSILEYTSNVIVVNDGSTDSTATILENYKHLIHVESYSKNKGKGFALRRAFSIANQQAYRYAITIDSDGQHYASDIPYFIAEIELLPDSLIVGSRQLKQDNMAKTSSFANKFSNFWFRLQTGIELKDTQSGYRLYPLYSMGNMKVITNRYEAELEILVFSAWRGIHCTAIPISVYYAPKNEKVTHFRPFLDFTRISILNTFLVFIAIFYGYPAMLIRKLGAKKSN